MLRDTVRYNMALMMPRCLLLYAARLSSHTTPCVFIGIFSSQVEESQITSTATTTTARTSERTSTTATTGGAGAGADASQAYGVHSGV